MSSINLGVELRITNEHDLLNAIRDSGGQASSINGVITAQFNEVSLEFIANSKGFIVKASGQINNYSYFTFKAQQILDDIEFAYKRKNFLFSYQKIKGEHIAKIVYCRTW